MSESSVTDISPARTRFLLILVLGGLVLSGVAGIINQVLWQRALKIYLAGSEAISAMIVVFVFMLGLGIGSQWAGRLASRLRNPLASLATVELGLAIVNSLICGLLAMDITESIYSFQRVVASLGIPLRVLYAVTAIVLLSGPCFLMGMTVPFATEGCQRQLRIRENRFLGNLFFLNTGGAVIGAMVSGFVILPIIGQKLGLLLAIGLNSLAGLVIVLVALRHRLVSPAEVNIPSEEAEVKQADEQAAKTWVRPELLVGFGLGFLSLAYEMYLFRIAGLVHGPFPFNFSLVLALFLLTWSIGAGIARFLPRAIAFWLIMTAISMLVVPQLYSLAREIERPDPDVGFRDTYLTKQWAYFAACFIPCVFFGVLFTQVVARFATSWGLDVGRYFAFNTFGSCVGILAGTLIGFEFAPEFTPWTIAWGLVAIWFFTRRTWEQGDVETQRIAWQENPKVVLGFVGLFFVICIQQFWYWDNRGRSMEDSNIAKAYYGKGGVILIDKWNNLEWDGLWHSELKTGDSHVGTNNWRMAVNPFLCHTGETCPDVCVIGLGTGMTAGTLSKIQAVGHVDVYEINEELKQVLADFPDGTMNVATDPKITIRWQDGRSGLALNDKKYDIITQQPLWLKQAGSSILLSREYMELVKSRLKPDGIFCIYCNTASYMGTEEQARAVRRTAREVFPYGETFHGGYMIMVSQKPFHWNRTRIERKLAGEPQLRKECESKKVGLDKLVDAFDSERLSWDCPYLVTDDHPIIEYPHIVRMLVQRAEEK
ncbi:MAG: hypothetical protein Tsb009_37260 [Planctomycetaceae bacterium]